MKHPKRQGGIYGGRIRLNCSLTPRALAILETICNGNRSAAIEWLVDKHLSTGLTLVHSRPDKVSQG